ncbi:MAG: hypothetical protein ACREK6_00010 [Candidatus Rokuibacteriota bacterium]
MDTAALDPVIAAGLGTVPTRTFTFIVDPVYAPELAAPEHSGLRALIEDLRDLSPAITARLLMPSTEGVDADQLGDLFEPVGALADAAPLSLSRYMAEEDRVRLETANQTDHSLRLFGIATANRADGVVTDAAPLVGTRYPLLQHHRIRLIPTAELLDVVEVCAHGHSVFWSGLNPVRSLTPDIYYQWTHWKGRRLANWFSTVQGRLNEDTREALRNVILNRYPFILYSRDMVRFHELQLDHFSRRGLWRRFSTPLGYFMTNFYLHLWGMLEHLTMIAKYTLGLTVRDRDCGIKSERLLTALREQRPGLVAFLERQTIADWIAAMADARHAAAHRSMLLPTDIVAETEESRKTDDEIRAILHREDPALYRLFSGAMLEEFERQSIEHWRFERLRKIATNAVVVSKEAGGYIRFPVDSVDHDLQMLNGAIDAFLVALFGSR